MATRRKYKTGGRVHADLPVESTDVLLAPEEPAEVPADPAAHIAGDDDAVQRAALATQRAEELQRAHAAQQQAQQQQRPATVEDVIRAAPISEHKRAFLRANPTLVTDARQQQLLGKHYSAALAQGVADDSPEMNRAILDGVARDLELHRSATALARAETGLALAESEVDTHDASGGSVAAPSRSPELPPAPIAASVLPPPPIKRSAPMTAPVSRDIPTFSGKAVASEKTITLSPEERIIARNSFGAIKGRNGAMVDLSDEQKERMYASNKMKMLAMRANGQLNE